MADTAAWPTELKVSRDRRTLTIAFDDGETQALSAEYLRVLAPSADVQGHSPAQKQTVAGKSNVAIVAVEPVGNYAVRITFDDMHSNGIYVWDYLRKLGRERETIWAGYVGELAAKGLSR